MSFDPSTVKLTPVDELPEGKEKGKEKKEKTKKKPKYSKGRYAKVPVTTVINKGVINLANTTVLKDKKKKLKKGDSEIGEALMYMVEYYSAIDVNHPALVMLSAIMGVSFTVIEYMAEEPTEKAKSKKHSEKIDPEEVAK